MKDGNQTATMTSTHTDGYCRELCLKLFFHYLIDDVPQFIYLSTHDMFRFFYALDVNHGPLYTIMTIVAFEGERDKDCDPLMLQCPLEKWLVLPQRPFMFGFFRFVYLTNRTVREFTKNVAPDFICFHARRCLALLPYIIHIEMISGLVCCRFADLSEGVEMGDFQSMEIFFHSIALQCLMMGAERSCLNSSYFHCEKSLKCISYYRVSDGFEDCYYGEDESSPSCQLNDSNRFMCRSKPDKCLSLVAISNGQTDCPGGEDERTRDRLNVTRPLSFGYFCDGVGETELGGRNETDETHCEWWPCNNSYTRCNTAWQCLNGADELNCPNSRCAVNEYECKSSRDGPVLCLPEIRMFDEYIDNCGGGTFVRKATFNNGTSYDPTKYYAWNRTRCLDAHKICRQNSATLIAQEEVCFRPTYPSAWAAPGIRLMNTNLWFCYIYSNRLDLINNFVTSQLGYFPTKLSALSVRFAPAVNKKQTALPEVDIRSSWYCNRGILILSGADEQKTCLCPPSYFGVQCQWQSQRVSLTLQLLSRNSESTSEIFQVIIMLIDEQGQIAPNYERIMYIPARDCGTKFNIYLLYPSRPKNRSANYSIHLDVFDKTTLEYRASWYVPIPFSFLPVNPIVTQLLIPGVEEADSCPLLCGTTGRCVRYTNRKSLFFCRCDRGYSGSLCNIEHTCHCSKDSLCLLSSICVCPLHKFGSNCYLNRSTCQSVNNSCRPHGRCIPTDDRIDLKAFTCLCTPGYSGERCEIPNNRIDINIGKQMMANASFIFFHFIAAFKNVKHERTTRFKKIGFNQHMITLDVSQPFNLLFTEFPYQNYYLTVVRELFLPSEHIHTQVSPKQRCFHTDELFNTSFRSYQHLRRIKYYPLLCRQNLQLTCFFDGMYMCICDLERFSNCFAFNSTMTYDCEGYNDCENGGQCFQNNETCPSSLVCVCPDCFYGSKCQFSTNGFILSLDPILGYHIKPNVSLNQQPWAVKVSIAISTIIFFVGLITGSLSVLTFRAKNLRTNGCGCYLLASSSISMCMIAVLTMKFWQLILSQMEVLTNRSLLTFNCVIIDGVLKALLASIEWLNACVAMERIFSVMQGANFDKKKSKQISQWMIFCVLVLTTSTHLQDPIHRHLIDDIVADEQRTWCFVRYSPAIEIINSFITAFHFLVPVVINFVSALLIVISVTRSRSRAQSNQSFRQHLQQQLHRHKHLLYAPVVLILLGLPRVIIAFVSGCMKSARDPWLFLIGYFISFVPSTLTFFVFVLPSTNYKSEFDAVVQQIMKRLAIRS